MKDVGWTKKVAQSRKVTKALKVTMDRARDAWKVMITYAKEHST